LLGLPLGYCLAMLMSVIYDTEMFRFPLISPPPVWINTVVLAIVFAAGAHLIVQWNVHRLDWLEASKTKE
jgi:putative ABC transport system permease protein